MTDNHDNNDNAVGQGGSDLIFVTGLWINKSKSGNTYMSGGFGFGGRVFIFRNKSKQRDSDPDYVLKIGAKADRANKEVDDEPPF